MSKKYSDDWKRERKQERRKKSAARLTGSNVSGLNARERREVARLFG